MCQYYSKDQFLTVYRWCHSRLHGAAFYIEQKLCVVDNLRDEPIPYQLNLQESKHM